MELVERLTVRYNSAVVSETMPECTCRDSYGGFDVKFCKFGVVEQGKKIADTCCADDLVNLVKE